MIDPVDPGTVEMPLSGGGGALIGYARVSTADQDLALQIDALRAAGCRKIFKDVASGVKSERPGLDKCMEHLRSGDTLLVWKIDRLGRSLPHLVELVDGLNRDGVGFRSLTNAAINTTTPDGALIFRVFAALAEYEREMISERTHAGLRAARARGTPLGRRPVITTEILEDANKLIKKGLTVRQAAGAVGVSKTALYSALAKKGDGNESD